ncbi:RNA polymerase subunit sigma-24 [bacterium]|nr:sigma-70 family RNA polymerase sigma factor [Chloroflexi bacterium CFX6]RIL07775.1 MAG: RNA polymerase subunit sigma-24 [bacterium]
MEGEAAWIEAAGAGDKRAFERLVIAYQKPVYSLAYRMLGNARDAEDAAQESFVRCYRALGSYDRRRPFSTWLLSIVAHHCIDRLRRQRLREVSLDGLPTWRWMPGDAVDPEAAAEAGELTDHIGGLLLKLPEDYRLALVLRYWHDLGYEEIGEMTGQTVSAVKSRLHRARRQLAEIMVLGGGRGPLAPDGADDPRASATPIQSGGVHACTATMPAI